MFAVCGTHQLVAYAFADWRAVGHLTPANQPVPTVQEEFNANTSLIPVPRLGEVGVFPMRICAGKEFDPLFSGLSERLWFEEQHHDQVIPGFYNPEFEALLEPDYNMGHEIHVKNDFGAVGDNIADDTEAIQAAIDAAALSNSVIGVAE